MIPIQDQFFFNLNRDQGSLQRYWAHVIRYFRILDSYLMAFGVIFYGIWIKSSRFLEGDLNFFPLKSEKLESTFAT